MFGSDRAKRCDAMRYTSLAGFHCLVTNKLTGGHLKPDLFNGPGGSLFAEFGVEAAAEAAVFEADHVDVIKELVEKENIDCDLVITRAADVQFNTASRDKLKAGYDRLVKSGVAAVKDVSFTADEKAEAVSCVF